MKKKVLVTGGSGFVGTELVRQLLDKGYRVRIVDVSPPIDKELAKESEFNRFDLRQERGLTSLFGGVDFCVHLAARVGGIRLTHGLPATILTDDTRIDLNVIDAASREGLERFVYASSSLVYESSPKVPHREDDMINAPLPKTTHGLAKLFGEKLCHAHYEERGLNYSVCRLFNVYGVNPNLRLEKMESLHVIPDLAQKVIFGIYPLPILGDGKQTRSFTHVRDIAAGMIAVMEEKRAANQIFNIANAHEVKIIDLAKTLWKLCGRKEEFKVKHLPGLKNDVRRSFPDVSKVKSIAGWEAKISLESGLPEVVDWMRSYLSKSF